MALQRYQHARVASAAHTSGSLQQTSIKQYLPVDQPASYTYALEGLQKALETCPSAETKADGPSHLRVTLSPHQKRTLALLLWREEQNPCGGILDKPSTLVICPASNMDLWKKKVERCCEPGQLNIYLYRGTNREITPEKLDKYDMVFASYNQVRSDLKSLDVKGVKAAKDDEASTGSKNQLAFLREFWDRIILDEADNIKNHKSQTAIAICRLEARARWAVTGYPIQNNTVELFSLIRFLRCTPFDKYEMWKRQIENAGSTKSATLQILVKSLVLQRTKDQKTSSGNPIEIAISLWSEPRKCYNQLSQQYSCTPYKLVNQLRLRQCCDHLSLLKKLLDQLESCETVEPSFSSAKIKFVIDRLEEIRAACPADRPMKSVLVSQWTGMLDVVASHLKKAGFKYCSIRGDIPPKKRDEAMEDFNNPSGPEVMLVSMKVRRGGLNPTRDNYIFFLDMPWNPFVEDQACDWIYRPGQTRSVHKLVCSNTIEEKILQRQTEKRQLANDVLTGPKSKKVKRNVRQI